MRINQIMIKNFRCYYGENNINFNNEGKITLIYGDSGFGKSSFLQFFRWMFYNDPYFGKNDDKPLFNIPAYKELEPGDTIEVKGEVNFEHMGVKYSLEKNVSYSVSLNMDNSRLESAEYTLQYLEDNNWVSYKEDVYKKINSIMPKGLSKYFLLDGERAREIVLNSSDLKDAIHSLFGIDAYEKAIDHLGTKFKTKTVTNYYNSLMTSQLKPVSTNIKMSPEELKRNIEELNDDIDNDKKLRKDNAILLKNNESQREDILKKIGELNNKENIETIIKQNDEIVKNKEKQIELKKQEVGNLLYKNFPYIIMTGITSKSSKVLRECQETFAVNYRKMFDNLRKELLVEVLKKGECICGRKLDEESTKFINNTIHIMPPDSYTYQFGQFVSKAKSSITNSKLELDNYPMIIDKITELQNDITKIDNNTKSKMEELKRIEESKDLVDELERLNKEQIFLKKNRTFFDGEIAKKEQTLNISEQQFKKMVAADKVYAKYNRIISFLQDVRDTLQLEKRLKEEEVADTLNDCVKDIFKKLTTQTELDVNKIKFVNKDFSLRTTYLTGGQLAIDVYSYVIGIVKALQQLKMENNENPIIIDAPFAFTGNEQSEHIFKTLPTVVKQTILLTLDLNKIRGLLDNEDLYELYLIKNDSQDKAIIERGTVNDIEF